MLGEILTTLHQGNRMGMDLFHGVDCVIRKTADGVLDVELVLSNYRRA